MIASKLDNMIRAQISLDQAEHDLAKLSIRLEGTWMKYAGFVETRDPLSSQAIDDLIYDANH